MEPLLPQPSPPPGTIPFSLSTSLLLLVLGLVIFVTVVARLIGEEKQRDQGLDAPVDDTGPGDDANASTEHSDNDVV